MVGDEGGGVGVRLAVGPGQPQKRTLPAFRKGMMGDWGVATLHSTCGVALGAQFQLQPSQTPQRQAKAPLFAPLRPFLKNLIWGSTVGNGGEGAMAPAFRNRDSNGSL